MDLRRTRTKPVSVLIVDGQELIRVGLHTMLSRHDDINVVGEASTVKGAVNKSCRLKPDVVLLDVRLPSGSGVEACRAIRSSCPNTRVLFLSLHENDEAVLAVVAGEASGYLLKHVNAKGLWQAIHAVAQGQSILDPAITHPVLTHMQLRTEAASAPSGGPFPPSNSESLNSLPKGEKIRRSARCSNSVIRP